MNVKLGSMKRLDVFSLNFDFCMEMQYKMACRMVYFHL